MALPSFILFYSTSLFLEHKTWYSLAPLKYTYSVLPYTSNSKSKKTIKQVVILRFSSPAQHSERYWDGRKLNVRALEGKERSRALHSITLA